jgi:hypothetical protein
MIQKSKRLYDYPPIIERLCKKTNYYNFNIVETEEYFEDLNEPYKEYNYEQIIINNPVTREKLLMLMSVEGLDSSEYIDMVNKDCDDLGI